MRLRSLPARRRTAKRTRVPAPMPSEGSPAAADARSPTSERDLLRRDVRLRVRLLPLVALRAQRLVLAPWTQVVRRRLPRLVAEDLAAQREDLGFFDGEQ